MFLCEAWRVNCPVELRTRKRLCRLGVFVLNQLFLSWLVLTFARALLVVGNVRVGYGPPTGPVPEGYPPGETLPRVVSAPQLCSKPRVTPSYVLRSSCSQLHCQLNFHFDIRLWVDGAAAHHRGLVFRLHRSFPVLSEDGGCYHRHQK